MQTTTGRRDLLKIATTKLLRMLFLTVSMLLLPTTLPANDACIFVDALEQDKISVENSLAITQELLLILRSRKFAAAARIDADLSTAKPEQVAELGFTHLLHWKAEQWNNGPYRLTTLRAALTNLSSGENMWQATVSEEYATGLKATGQSMPMRIHPMLQNLVHTLPQTLHSVSDICWKTITNVSKERDQDKDGIPDSQDKCRTEAEDINGYLDEDGCPEQIPLLNVKVRDSMSNQPIDSAISILSLGKLVRNLKGDFVMAIPVGKYVARVSAKNYSSKIIRVATPQNRPYVIKLDKAKTKAQTPPAPKAKALKQIQNKSNETNKNVPKPPTKSEIITLCSNNENRLCLEQLSTYLKSHKDQAMTKLKNEVKEGLESTTNELYKLGLNEFRQENIEEAASLWRDALELDPEDSKIRKAYERATGILQRLK